MQRNETISAVGPLLRRQKLRLLLVAAPGFTAAVAILTAMESNLAFTVALNAAVGVIISSVLFIAVSMASRQVADERVELMRATQQGLWHARLGQFLPTRHEKTGLYSFWYFRLRLQEEIERAQRYGLQFSILLAKPAQQQGEPGAWLDERAQQALRRTDLPALLRDGSIGMILPHTEPADAQALQRRLASELSGQEVRFGLAHFPSDGEDTDTLLAAAEAAAKKQAEAA